MNPLLQNVLESKASRRKRLMVLPYPAKVRIVEQLRKTALEIRSAAGNRAVSNEDPTPYKVNRP